MRRMIMGAAVTAITPTAAPTAASAAPRTPAKAPSARTACQMRADNNFITYNNRLPRTARIMTAGASRMTDAAAADAAAIRYRQTRGVPCRW